MRKMKQLVYFIALLFSFELYSQNFDDEQFSQVLVTNGISTPTAMAFTPDGRIFVTSQSGALRVIKNGTLLTTPFVSLTVNSSGERGLIGVAVDPDFATNHYVYLYHTVPGSPPHNRVTRYTADGDVALTGSDVTVIDLDPLSSATNHNGGAMHFGLDGKLYVAVGDNANGANAQNLDTYHGKLLRMNADGSIPGGNPFTTGTEQRRRVWAYGLRNPYTFSIQPGTGKLFVNDVGQSTWEEINDATTGGLNFGWPSAEGNSANPAYTNPVYVYGHGGGTSGGCAITGGTFFNPASTNYPAQYAGRYFYQEFCNNWMGVLDLTVSPASNSLFASSLSGSGLAVTTGPDGNLYYLSRQNSALYKIVYTPPLTPPAISNHPSNITVPEGGTATFTVSASGTQPLQYQWQKNNANINGATSASYTINNAAMASAGNYRVVITNVAGSATSNNATLTVVANKPPVATITSPVEGTQYTAGSMLAFAGNGTDQEDGTLPASAFSWAIDFHHDTHKHDQPAINGVKSGAYDIPDEGETSFNVWYRLILTVTDSRGLAGKDSVDVHPRLSTIALNTIPEGLQVTLDGQPVATPASVIGVEGIKRAIGTTAEQVLDGQSYTFDSWSNGGSVQQIISTPADDISLVATFNLVVSVDEKQQRHSMVAYPNPADGDYITLAFTLTRSETVEVVLLNTFGQQVSEVHKQFDAGKHALPISVGSLSSGIYQIRVNKGGQVSAITINRVR